MNSRDKLYGSNDKVDDKLTPLRLVILILGGLIVGFIAGLFGGGGGIIIVPLLTFIGGIKEKEAHATSIAVVFPMAIVCMIVYFIMGTRVEVMPTVYTTIGIIAGGLVGTLLLRKLSSTALKVAFYIIMIIAGIRMIMG